MWSWLCVNFVRGRASVRGMRELFRYVALGDSTGVGVGANTDGGYPERLFRRLKSTGINAGILSLAQSGVTARELVQTQLPRAVSSRPALVTLGVGTNDLWRMVPVTSFEASLRALADQLEATGAEVVISNLVDLTRAPIAQMVEALLGIPRLLFEQRLEELNTRINQLARRRHFTVVDLYGFSRRELGNHSEYFCPDGFHPSGSGYDRWAEIMWPAVENAARAWRERRSVAQA